MRFITQISKEIFSQKYFWIITSVIMLTNIVEAQENKSVLNYFTPVFVPADGWCPQPRPCS